MLLAAYNHIEREAWPVHVQSLFMDLIKQKYHAPQIQPNQGSNSTVLFMSLRHLLLPLSHQ